MSEPLTKEDLAYIESRLQLSQEALLLDFEQSGNTRLINLGAFHHSIPEALLSLYRANWTIWLHRMRDDRASWAMLKAAPCSIMGDWTQLHAAPSSCVSIGNNASISSFSISRMPENLLAAQRVLLRNQHDDFDSTLSLLSSRDYFKRNPQKDWFLSYSQIAEAAGFSYTKTPTTTTPPIVHLDVHPFGYFVELGKLESPSNKAIVKRYKKLDRTPPSTATEFKRIRTMTAMFRSRFNEWAEFNLRSLLNVFQPSCMFLSLSPAMYRLLLPKFEVIEGPMTLVSRVKYTSHFDGATLRQHYQDPTVRFINSSIKGKTVALVAAATSVVEDSDAILYKFKLAVLKFTWGHLYTLIDPCLISVPFNTSCAVSKQVLGQTFTAKVAELQLLLGSSSAFAKAEPQFPAAPIKKKHRRKRTHKAILQSRGEWIDNFSSLKRHRSE